MAFRILSLDVLPQSAEVKQRTAPVGQDKQVHIAVLFGLPAGLRTEHAYLTDPVALGKRRSSNV